MATPRGINQKGKYTALNARLNRYLLLVKNVFDTCGLEVAKIAERTGYSVGDVPFRFADFPITKSAILGLQKRFVDDMGAIIYRGTSEEWKQSNLVQDLLADKVLKFYGSKAGGEKHKVYYQTNSDVLKAFQQRKISGEFHLSEVLWNQSENYKTEMEYAISSALEKGTSAVTLSKRLSKYLNDFDKLKDDYKERYGKAVDCQDCEYRSMRLARSEINMAYRTAEQERWKQMDFVLGFEIKLSKSHHDRMPKGDICDDLAGKYPKDFKWTGWHPNDMCYLVPILKSEDEFFADDDEPCENEVKEYPDSMKDWLADNAVSIIQSEKSKTLPYWLRDNKLLVDEAKKSMQPFEMTDDIRNELEIRGFSKRRFVSSEFYNSSAMAGFDILRFDKHFEKIFDEYSVKFSAKELSDNHGIVKLRYKGSIENGSEMEMTRLFRFETIDGRNVPVVDHALFVLPDDIQGKGISKRVFAELIMQYEKAGISRAYVHANMDVGGYCWAKYGCYAEKKSVKETIDAALTNGKISAEEFQNAMSYIEGYDSYVPMQGLAFKSYGKRLLMDSSWHGIIDLNDVTQMEYLKKYAGM